MKERAGLGAQGKLEAPQPRPLRELSALVEIAGLPWYWLRMKGVPRGAARVLVVPGFMTGDGSTWLLRRTLSALGHRVYGWGMGRNRGDVEGLIPLLGERVRELSLEGPIHLIGWSLGGYLAREVAREHPESVVQVITLASPVIGGPKYTVAAKYYREQLGLDLDEMEREVARREVELPLRVPVTALYSPDDNVVCPAACVDHRSEGVEHIAVSCSHVGFGFSAKVFDIVASRLVSVSG